MATETVLTTLVQKNESNSNIIVYLILKAPLNLERVVSEIKKKAKGAGETEKAWLK